MSFFEDASLVLIPSAQKTSKVYSVKPTDGTGDLTFTRSNDTATRVGPDGLIEKVRTNLFSYSEQFNNAYWTKYGSTITTNTSETTDPLGGNAADIIVSANATGACGTEGNVTYTSGAEFTISLYAKYKNTSFIQMLAPSFVTTEYVNFNIQTGAIVGGSYAYTPTITSVGNGWYRCSFTFVSGYTGTTAASPIFLVDSASATRGQAFTGDGVKAVYIFGAQTETGVATPYIATTTAAVSVGPVANVPRLDYLGSSCPRLLLEPQRTNLMTYSEQFDNAAYVKVGVSVTANNAVSPDGFTNADLITADGTNSQHEVYQGVAGGTTNSNSIFVKKGTARYINLITNYISSGDDWVSVVFDLDTLTSNVQQAGAITSASVKIENYGSGWYRLISNTNAASATTLLAFYGIVGSANPTRELRGRVTLTSSATIYLYGAQFEAAAYATSYIPTLGAAVTRGADAASKTGISSLIGQTEGTIFVEGSIIGDDSLKDNLFAALEKTSSGATMRIFNSATTNVIIGDVYTGSGFSAQMSGPAIPVGQTFKAALAYKENDFVLAVNGVIVATDNSGVVPATDDFKINTSIYNNLDAGVRQAQALLFKTRLTNAQLAELTA